MPNLKSCFLKCALSLHIVIHYLYVSIQEKKCLVAPQDMCLLFDSHC